MIIIIIKMIITPFAGDINRDINQLSFEVYEH